ncbi:MAG: FAD-dependent oxidoreductase [Clostridia bacterium]|nr:FAD-dependent oxidoreductase [Clostridia bacterium]
MHVLIVGGGAAGMAAAIAAAKRGRRVTVLERGRKTLKKLGVTGNGRGNLLNCGENRYYGDAYFAQQVLSHMPYAQIAAFLEEAGIPLVHEAEGRMYPSSYLAASAVDALNWQADALGVEKALNTRAVRIEKNEKGFRVHAVCTVYGPDITLKSGRVKPGEAIGEEPVCFDCDRVIVTVGGAAAPVHGTDGSAYGLLTDLGHELSPIRPALSALITGKKAVEGLNGQRVRAKLALRGAEGALIHQSEGEALFAEDGVSGIAAMQLSRFVCDGCVLHMDLRLAVTGDENADVSAWLNRRLRTRDHRTLLTGAASPALANALWRRAGQSVERLAEVIADFAVPVTGVRGFESAQVTAGGVKTADFDPAAMQSRLVPGLYAAGEVLDVDGACGGYNLMFAFAGGLLAGGHE